MIIGNIFFCVYKLYTDRWSLVNMDCIMQVQCTCGHVCNGLYNFKETLSPLVAPHFGQDATASGLQVS